jgi:beta-glucosidase
LILDGGILIDIPRRWWSPKSALFMSYGSPEERVQISLQAQRPYKLVLESVSREPKPYDISFTGELEREEVQDGGRIGFFENPGDLDDMFQDAVNLAESCDYAVVVVGKDHEWETETSDMVSMDLPGRSDDLISAVSKVNQNVIVVNQTGSPITMPWVDEVSVILQAWYQGQEQGNALADVLLGDTNPSGRLPITFPRRIQDTPAFDNYPGDNDKTTYGEDIYLGYRFYDHRQIQPLFPFGAGLSYTNFVYTNIRLTSPSMAGNGAPDDGLEVQVDVRNTGTRDGKETVQFYVSPLGQTRLRRPPQELKAWDKVYIKAGETVTARARLDRVSVSYWDDGIHEWVADANARFKVTAARDSRDLGLVAEFQVLIGSQWIN